MTTKNPVSVWRIKVELEGVVPAVWRRFDTYADVKLSQLHYYIQGAMGWELAHMFAFEDEHNRGIQISNALRLCDVCRVGGTLSYAYDFGDDWQHLVTVEKVMVKPTGAYPHLVTGKSACPPEDSGGPWGYAEIREVLAGRSNARKRELVEWLGKSFDPKAFDIDAARARLAEYVELSRRKEQE
jgi:hypothetical protein